jgi:hypothetical protein
LSGIRDNLLLIEAVFWARDIAEGLTNGERTVLGASGSLNVRLKRME